MRVVETEATLKRCKEMIVDVSPGLESISDHEITLVMRLSREEYLFLAREALNKSPVRVSLSTTQLSLEELIDGC